VTERPEIWHYFIVPKVLLWLCFVVAWLVLVNWLLGTTPLICEESWYEWPAKHWLGCIHHETTVVFPNWVNSLATGDATIGSYLIAAILAAILFLYLPFIGLIIAANRLGEWMERRRAEKVPPH
jgi:hypothetical protein